MYFEPDAGKAQDYLRNVSHSGRGLIIGAGWDRDLHLTTNYVGFTGGLRVIEDIYNGVLATYGSEK